MNQEIPLEIFEPPSDFKHINWMAGKDYNGLNAGVFLLRVNTWSLNLLNRVMTYKHYHPNEEYVFEEQTILARLTENDDEFKKESIYVPKSWFNAYFYSLQEVKPGLLLSHFPHPDYKWHIYEWLRVLESDKDSNYKPVYKLYLWLLTDPSNPILIGDLNLVRSTQGVSLRYADAWLEHGFSLSEDMPLIGQEFLPTERGTAVGAVDDARPGTGRKWAHLAQ